MMRKYILLALALLTVVALATACPRGNKTNVAVSNPPPPDTSQPPAANGQPPAPGADNTAAPGGKTDVNVNVDNKPPATTTPPADNGKQAGGDNKGGDNKGGDNNGKNAGDNNGGEKKPAEPSSDSGTTKVKLVTTKGDIEVTVHPDWDPDGADRFITLVKAGYYNGSPWFRVINGFIAQTGVSPDAALQAKWQENLFKDDPVVKGNLAGTLAFAKPGAPDHRSTMFFINLADNTGSLDTQGFSAFAEITSGMDVALKLAAVEFQDQGALQGPGGIDAFKKQFPDGDFITSAAVEE